MLEVATPTDAAAVLVLRDAAARRLLARGIEQWHPGERSLASFRAAAVAGTLFVWRSAGSVAGAVVIVHTDEPIWGPPAGDEGYVHTLVTDGRHPGLGRRVLAAAEDRIRAAGRRRARLDCVASNPRLAAYYRAAGYTGTGTRSLPPPWPPVTLFEKPLG